MEDSETGQRKTSLEKVSLNLNRCNNSLYVVVDPDSGFHNLDLYPVPDPIFWFLGKINRQRFIIQMLKPLHFMLRIFGDIRYVIENRVPASAIAGSRGQDCFK
jgi:hypothetical protein